MDNMRTVLSALSDKFISIHIFNMNNDDIEVIKTNKYIDQFAEGSESAQDMLVKVMRNIADEESRDSILNFVDLTDLAERMNGENMISQLFLGRVNGWSKASFIKMNEGEELTRMIFAVEPADEAVTREKMLMEVNGVLSKAYTSLYWIDIASGYSHNLRFDDVGSRYLPDEQSPTFEKLGRKYMDDMIFREDVPELEPYFNLETVKERLKTEKQLQHTYRTVRDGETIYYRLKIVPFDKGRKFVLGFENVDAEYRREQDIQARDEHMMELQTGLSREYSTVWEFDSETHQSWLVKSNRISSKTTEMINNRFSGEYDQVMSDFIETFVVPEEREMMCYEMSIGHLMSCTDESQAYHVNFTINDLEGERHYFQACVTRVNRTTGDTRFVFGVRNIDSLVLEQKAREEELEKAKVQAEAASEAKTTFLFNMSHDIRTPLNAVTGFLNLAKYSDSADEVSVYTDKALHSAEQLTDILNNILEMARIEKGTIEVEEEIMDAEEVFQSQLILFETRLKEKNIELIVNNGIKHRYLYGDRTLIKEIYLNLMSNAYKYTPEGGRITVDSRELPGEDPNHCWIEASITDTGIGMSEEFVKHAFDAFQRERSKDTIDIQGTGLGLSIVKHLVSLMGGSISVESEPGEGSTFTIRLPHEIGEESDIVGTQIIEDEEYNEFLKGKRVLLAEDNEVNAEIAINLMQINGLGADRVANGLECVQKIYEVPAGYYDLILMDIQMPIMDGYKATHEIRSMKDEAKAKIPIVALSANAFKEDMDKSRQAGMNDHLAKPIDLRKFTEAMARAMQNHHPVSIEELLEANGTNIRELDENERGIYCTDETRRIIFWNRKAEELTGYSREEMLGKDCFSSGLDHENEKGEHLCEGKCPVMATIMDGAERSARVSACCCGGSRRWITVSTQALKYNDRIRGAVEYFEPNEG